MARNLQIQPENLNKNTRWWHQVGRPTLENCMAELEEDGIDDETDSHAILKPATTVVMKLLLYALELEVNPVEDYSHMLSTALPISSLFLLCRTIFIHDGKRQPQYRDLDEDDDYEEGVIRQEEDGSFIIRPTSPGRAQATAAALMNVFRVTLGAAMIHASETNNLPLQRVLYSPSVLSQSRAVRDLAYRSKIARTHARNIITGTARAQPVVDQEGDVTAWKITTPEHDLLVRRTDITCAVRQLVDHCQKSMELILGHLGTNQAFHPILKNDSEIFKADEEIGTSLANLKMAMFGRPAGRIPGREIDF
jgi:hypothetical protein